MGRNIKRFREMKGKKQDALASELGGDWTQRKISAIEQMETVEQEILEQIAKALNVTTDLLSNFDEDTAFNVISNVFNDSAVLNANYRCTFNPIDKVVELYERLLQSEKEKNELLSKLHK